MSAIAECGPPCVVAALVQIPGPAGPAGKNASTTTTAAVTISITPNVVIPVVDSSWMITNMLVMINDGDPAGHYGLYQVTANPVFPYTSFIGTLIAQDSVPPGTVVASGAVVTPGAINGNSAWTTTTAIFSVLAPPNTTSIVVANAQGFADGQIIIVGNSSEYAHFQISSVIANTINGNYLNLIGDAPTGALFPAGATVSPSGNDGISVFTTTTDIIKLPAGAGSLATTTGGSTSIPVFSTAQFAVNEYVMVSDTTPHIGSFQVAAILDATHLRLTWLDNSGDSAAGSTIASGSNIVPVGSPATLQSAIISDYTDYTLSGAYAVATPIGSGWNIPANSLTTLKDSLVFEIWLVFTTAAGDQTISITLNNVAIFTSGLMAVGVNSAMMRITGRIVLNQTSPSTTELCLAYGSVAEQSTTNGYSTYTYLQKTAASAPISAIMTLTALAITTSASSVLDIVYCNITYQAG